MEISGVCGRLLCCLAYENDFYGAVKKRMPREGSEVETARGTGRIVSLNVLQESVDVQLEDDTVHTFSLEELQGPPQQEAPRRSRKRGRGRRR
jgi:cell fate regulator YaaT (PSP1 superfamily)